MRLRMMMMWFGDTVALTTPLDGLDRVVRKAPLGVGESLPPLPNLKTRGDEASSSRRIPYDPRVDLKLRLYFVARKKP